MKTLAAGEKEQEGGLLGLTRSCHLQGDFGFVQLVLSWLCGSQQHGAKQDKLGHILRAAGDREDSAGQSWLSERALDLGSSPSHCLFPAQHLPTGITPSPATESTFLVQPREGPVIDIASVGRGSTPQLSDL